VKLLRKAREKESQRNQMLRVFKTPKNATYVRGQKTSSTESISHVVMGQRIPPPDKKAP